jgi:hypothetical protein
VMANAKYSNFMTGSFYELLAKYNIFSNMLEFFHQ